MNEPSLFPSCLSCLSWTSCVVYTLLLWTSFSSRHQKKVSPPSHVPTTSKIASQWRSKRISSKTEVSSHHSHPHYLHIMNGRPLALAITMCHYTFGDYRIRLLIKRSKHGWTDVIRHSPWRNHSRGTTSFCFATLFGRNKPSSVLFESMSSHSSSIQYYLPPVTPAQVTAMLISRAANKSMLRAKQHIRSRTIIRKRAVTAGRAGCQ
jgi:hypothetical protein